MILGSEFPVLFGLRGYHPTALELVDLSYAHTRWSIVNPDEVGERFRSECRLPQASNARNGAMSTLTANSLSQAVSIIMRVCGVMFA